MEILTNKPLNKKEEDNSIGIRFQIDKINDDDGKGYGYGCWKIFWKSVNIDLVKGAKLTEGDTNDSPDKEYVYCLGINWLIGESHSSEIRTILEKSSEFQKVAAKPPFITPKELSKELLVDAGSISLSGVISGGMYRALPAYEMVDSIK